MAGRKVNSGLAHYFVDHLYGTLMHRLRLHTPFFSKGWGGKDLAVLETITRQLIGEGLENVSAKMWPPPCIRPVWRTLWQSQSSILEEATFETPCEEDIMRLLPVECHMARVRLLRPRHLARHETAVVIHLAGTGDHGFDRRLRIGGPLVKQGIATMVLESPFYGGRRPLTQRGAKLRHVSDLLLLGRVTIEESRALLYWSSQEAGFNKLGICGLSMGGVHAAMTGTLHPTPVAILPLLAPHSAAAAYLEGILQYGTDWHALMQDLRDELSSDMDSGAMTRDNATGGALTGIERARERLREVLSLTDVTRFPIPKNPKAAIFVAATHDGYVPKSSILQLQNAWPGSEVRWVVGGHVSSFVLHEKHFRKAIVDALDRLGSNNPANTTTD